MRISRGAALPLAGGIMKGDIDFNSLYQCSKLALPAANEALRKGNKDIANAEVSDAAGIAEAKLALAKGTQALFDKIGTDIGTHAGVAAAHHTKTIDASELSAGILALARLSGITDTQIAANASIALSKIVNTYLLPTVMTTRGDIVYRNASNPGRLPKGNAGKVLTMGADDPGWVSPTIPDATVGDAIEHSADKEMYTAAGAYLKGKEIRLARAGTYRIKFALKVDATDGTIARGRVYRNGGAVGTEQTNNTAVYQTMSEDIAGWAAGDLCQLYIMRVTAPNNAYAKDFRVCVTSPIDGKVILDAEGALT